MQIFTSWHAEHFTSSSSSSCAETCPGWHAVYDIGAVGQQRPRYVSTTPRRSVLGWMNQTAFVAQAGNRVGGEQVERGVRKSDYSLLREALRPLTKPGQDCGGAGDGSGAWGVWRTGTHIMDNRRLKPGMESGNIDCWTNKTQGWRCLSGPGFARAPSLKPVLAGLLVPPCTTRTASCVRACIDMRIADGRREEEEGGGCCCAIV